MLGAADASADGAIPPTQRDLPAPTMPEQSVANPMSKAQPTAEPAEVSGIERPASESNDQGRFVGAVLLFPIREAFHLLFAGADVLGEAAQRLRFIQRVDQLLFPKAGEIALVPTLFFESRHPPEFGGRLVAQGDLGKTQIAAASGGAHDFYVATIGTIVPKLPFATELSVDATFDERDNLEFYGIGQDPNSDFRNAYRPTASTHDALYLEQRSRVVANAEIELLRWCHAVASTSILESRVRDATGAGAAGLSQVFEPIPLIADAKETKTVYSELALRASSRRRWDGPEPGAQLEVYGGYGVDSFGSTVRYAAVGGRAVAFVPIQRPTNTLSPKIVIDAVEPTTDGLPFTALARQPDYRGFDLRRDKLSVVASLDYRWVFQRYVAARLFADAATVAPRFTTLWGSLPRFDGGVGLDVFTDAHPIAQMGISGSADGVRLFMTFGWAPLGGDRQHQN